MSRFLRIHRVLSACLGAAVLMALMPCSLLAYTQANLQTASDATIETIPLEATVQVSPAQIRIKNYAAGTFTIYRKAPNVTAWGAPVATGITLGIEGVWTDSAVVVGTLYEYRFVNTAGTTANGIYPTGYILTGINVDQTLAKGRMVIVVASDILSGLPAEYAQYKADLIADGWTVHEVPCARAVDYNGLGNAGIATVKVNAGGTGFVNGDYVTLTNPGGKRALGKLTVVAGAITVVAIPTGGSGAGFAVNDVLTVSGGSSVGTGANLTAHIDATQARLTSAFPDANGLGYTSGETVTLTGQTSGKTAQGTTSVFNTKLYGFSVVSSQTGFIVGEILVMTGNTTGAGVGPITVSSVTSGQLQSSGIHAPGTGYVQGDAGTLTGVSSGKTAQVTLNVNGGFLNGTTLVSSQTGFTPGEALTLSGTSAGSGAGSFTGNFTGPLQTVTVNTGGSGYVNGNAVTLTYGSATAQGVLNVTAGAITSVTVTSSGTGFAEGGGLTLSGLQTTATGYSLAVLTIDNSGVGRAVSVTSNGSGYRDNDSVAIRGATSNATATGSILAPAGALTAVSVVLPNTFTVGESLVFTPASGGSGAVATVGASTENHLLIRSAVQAIYNAYPGEVKSVAMIGKVPVCRTGINDGAGSDGHGNEASYGADAFYADMDGIVGTDWTDTQDNISGAASVLGDVNLPGDKQFDQQTIFQVGNGAVELGFGRIDLSLGIQTETEAMRAYFNKLHRYKIASADFQPGRRVCDRLSYPNEREAELQSMPGVVGMSNVEFTTTTTLPTVESGQDADQLYSTQHGPYLFYFKGSGAPIGGVGGKAVFWTGMQSHWGYWYQAGLVSSGGNYMQKRLAEDSFTLSFTWNIWGMRYIYHRMGMGLDAADMMKQSINNQGWGAGPYSYKFNNTSNGNYHGVLYMNHMGDPALRLFMFEPPSALSVVKSGSNPALTWSASPNASVIGYHIYRAANTSAPFTRLTSAPIAGTSYTDTSATTGSYAYMVRAVRLETTGGGTFQNASLGATQTFNLDATASAVAITTTTLPNVSWKTSASLTLNAQGGLPQYAWSLASGTLPQGMTLSGAGVISGTPTLVGGSSFTVRATDQIGQSATQALSITVTSNSALVLYPEATTYTNKAAATTSYGADEIAQISGVSTNMFETFHRYDLNGIALNNGFAKATLFLYVTSGTGTNNYAPVQANLIADAQDGWVDNGIAKPFSGYANNGANKLRINCPAHGFTTGTQVTIAGITGTGAPTGPYALTNVDADHFDLLTVAYNAAWAYDPALAFATVVSMTYNTRPTSYNTNVPTLNASGSDTPGTFLQFDVTGFVRETLANDPAKKMSLRFFSQTPLTVATASQNGFGGSRPYVLFETSDAPGITVNSPLVSPAYVFTNSNILLNTTVTPLPARAASLTMQWSKVSGPGTVTFTNATGAITGASFSTAGDYTLRLSVSDGIAQSTRDISVRSISANVAGPSDSSLKLRLALDETSGTTANDSSGNSPANNGTLINAPTWTTPGQINGAITFGATGKKISVPDSATNLLDGTQQITVSLWINPSSLPVGSTVYFGVITKRVAAFNKESWRIELRGSTAGTSSPVYCTVTGGTTLQSAGQITANKWQHIVMVFDGSTTANNLQLYLNGAVDKFISITPASVPRNATANVSIGSNDTYDFTGMMDEVRIYNRALTLAEVQDLYAAVPANVGPVVSIAAPITGNAGDAIALSGTATDDGKPSPLTLGWSTLSGPGSVTFANATSASTNVTFAQAGAFALRLTANDGAITTWANTNATIAWPPGINGWRQQYFGTTDASGNRADLANPANDGFSNLLKYALGLNPNALYNGTTVGIQLLVPALGSGNGLSYTFTGTASDVTYTVEANSDLGATWTPLYTHTGTAPGTVTVQDSQAVTAGAERFVRLRVTRP